MSFIIDESVDSDFPQINAEIIKKNKIKDLCLSLEIKKKLIADLLLEKEKEENELVDLIGHNKNHEGRLSYEIDAYVLRVTTGKNWSFDKKEYELMKSHIQPCFDPVKVKTVFELDKKIIENIETYASSEEREFLDKIFTWKEKKLNIVIEDKKR